MLIQYTKKNLIEIGTFVLYNRLYKFDIGGGIYIDSRV